MSLCHLLLPPPLPWCRFPQLLGLSLDSNLRPTTAYLSSIGVDLRRLLRTHGAALALSLDGKLRPTVLFLETEVGIGAIGRLLSCQPAILSLSVEANLRPKCSYLRHLGMENLGRLVSQYPPVLTLSLENNLMPTAQALAEAGVLHPPDPALRPRHLAASLEKRVRVGPSFLFLISFMLSYTRAHALPQCQGGGTHTRLGELGRAASSVDNARAVARTLDS